jgi:hypothetical protein
MGTVANHTSKTLLVIETDAGNANVHELPPGFRSPDGVDADAVRTKDGTPIANHPSWWKVRGPATATVTESALELRITDLPWMIVKAGDNEFGQLFYVREEVWGVPDVERKGCLGCLASGGAGLLFVAAGLGACNLW